MTREELSKLHENDYVLVKCRVEAVLVNSGMVCVSTRDCEDGFDAYMDEVIDVVKIGEQE